MTVPDTGGAQTWKTIEKTVALDYGTYKLRLVMDSEGPGGSVGNFNSFSFDPAADTAPIAPGTVTPTPTYSPTPTYTSTPTPSPTTTPVPWRQIPHWHPGVMYETGAQVAYEHVRYECLEGILARPKEPPPSLPEFWLRRDD
jgi:hypothetical protein